MCRKNYRWNEELVTTRREHKGIRRHEIHFGLICISISTNFPWLYLSYVIELSNLLRTLSSPDLDEVDDAADFVSFYPDLVWTLRDFYLSLQADGEFITADDYLENSLRPKQGNSGSSFGKREQSNTRNYLLCKSNYIFRFLYLLTWLNYQINN